MGNPLSSRQGLEYIAGLGLRETQTSRRSRAVLPSFSDAFGGGTQNIVALENVSVNVQIPSLAAGHSTTVSASQGFEKMNTVNPSSTDIGKIIFSNVSVAPPPGILPGHPTIQVVARQGAPPAGDLQPGLPYTKLSLSVGLTCYAMTGTTAGTATITAVAMLLGTAQGNQ